MWVKVGDLLVDVVRVEAHQVGTETKKEEVLDTAKGTTMK